MSFQKFKLTIFKLAQREKILHLTPSVNALQNLWEREYSPEDVIAQMHKKRGTSNG
jgi:hypothetical protein